MGRRDERNAGWLISPLPLLKTRPLVHSPPPLCLFGPSVLVFLSRAPLPLSLTGPAAAGPSILSLGSLSPQLAARICPSTAASHRGIYWWPGRLQRGTGPQCSSRLPRATPKPSRTPRGQHYQRGRRRFVPRSDERRRRSPPPPHRGSRRCPCCDARRGIRAMSPSTTFETAPGQQARGKRYRVRSWRGPSRTHAGSSGSRDLR